MPEENGWRGRMETLIAEMDRRTESRFATQETCFRTIREDLLERLKALKDEHDRVRREVASVTASTKADLDKRLETMNEFRETLTDQASTFITRERFDVEHKYLMDKVQGLDTWKSVHDGRATRSNSIALFAILIAVASAIIDAVK